MPSSEIFVNPEGIRDCANQLEMKASEIENTLGQLTTKIGSTQSIFESNSATDMRDRYEELKPELDKFYSYLRKVAAYLKQNVAEPAEVLDRVAQQNVANIKKPQ